MSAEATMPQARDGLEVAVLDGEAVVFDAGLHSVHHLNAAALAVWERCDGITPIETVITELATRFAVENARVRDDIGVLLEQLHAEELLTRDA